MNALVFEGKEYPVYRVSVSSASHPFFTGKNQFIDTEGRVDKFTKKYARKQKELKEARPKAVEKPKKAPKKSVKAAPKKKA